MKKLVILHDYSENIKSKINTFNLKGKEYVWMVYVKHIRGIKEEELIYDEFKRLFKKKYMFKRYYDRHTREFYELKMGYMVDDKYITKFMDLFRYVPYLKGDKTKVQRFISGFLITFKDRIEYDETWSLEEVIGKLKHCYEHYKCKSKFKQAWKSNDNKKGKWPRK